MSTDGAKAQQQIDEIQAAIAEIKLIVHEMVARTLHERKLEGTPTMSKQHDEPEVAPHTHGPGDMPAGTVMNPQSQEKTHLWDNDSPDPNPHSGNPNVPFNQPLADKLADRHADAEADRIMAEEEKAQKATDRDAKAKSPSKSSHADKSKAKDTDGPTVMNRRVNTDLAGVDASKESRGSEVADERENQRSASSPSYSPGAKPYEAGDLGENKPSAKK